MYMYTVNPHIFPVLYLSTFLNRLINCFVVTFDLLHGACNSSNAGVCVLKLYLPNLEVLGKPSAGYRQC